MFSLSPLELWLPLVALAYIVAFVRFAKRSKQRQAVARKVQEVAPVGPDGTAARLWLAAVKPNIFYARPERRAPVLLIVALLVLTALVEAAPQLFILARMGLALPWPSAETVGGAFMGSSLSGVLTNLSVLLLMAAAVRLGAGKNVRAWTVAGYALSPFVLIGAVNALLTLLAMVSPSLTLRAVLGPALALGELSPALLIASAALFGTAGLLWLLLPFYLSLRTLFAGVVAAAPERATLSTFLYLGLSAALAVGALFIF